MKRCRPASLTITIVNGTGRLDMLVSDQAGSPFITKRDQRNPDQDCFLGNLLGSGVLFQDIKPELPALT